MNSITIKDVAKVSNGKTPSRLEQREKGFPVLKIKNIDESGNFRNNIESFVDETLAFKFKEKILKVNDILILNAAHNASYVASKTYLVDNDASGNLATGEWTIIRPSEKIIPEYLYFWVNSKIGKYHLKQIVRGIHLYPKDVGNLKIPLVPLEKQETIVRSIKRVVSIQKKREQVIKHIDNYIESIFLETFGEPTENTNGWPITTLENITKKITDGTHQSPKFITEGIPFIFISNIIDNEIHLDTKKFISEATYRELTKSTPIEEHDVLYTTVGSYGNPAIVRNSDKFSFQRHIAHIKPDIQKTNVEFLYRMLKSPFIRRQADEKVRGVAQKTLNLHELKNFKVFLPPLVVQNNFSEIVQKTEVLKQKMHTQSRLLDLHYQSLIQLSFSDHN